MMPRLERWRPAFQQRLWIRLVDATAAVRLAESWQSQSTLPTCRTESAVHTDNATIPDGAGSLQSQITIRVLVDVEKW